MLLVELSKAVTRLEAIKRQTTNVADRKALQIAIDHIKARIIDKEGEEE